MFSVKRVFNQFVESRLAATQLSMVDAALLLFCVVPFMFVFATRSHAFARSHARVY